jgi:hypothetical protein
MDYNYCTGFRIQPAEFVADNATTLNGITSLTKGQGPLDLLAEPV